MRFETATRFVFETILQYLIPCVAPKLIIILDFLKLIGDKVT